MKTFKKNSRKWLNPPSHYDTGSVAWEVRTSGGDCSIEAELVIRDCSRRTTLNFFCESPKDLQERAAKINTLIDELTKMRAALGEAYELIDWQTPESHRSIIDQLYDE